MTEERKTEDVRDELESDREPESGITVKKKRGGALSVLYVIIFIVMLALPAVTMPLFRADGSAEKRDLAEFPQIKTEDGSFNFAFTEGLDAYIADHIGFRSALVRANGVWQAALFGKSAEEDVIVGSDGWLFYTETKYDYMNVPTLSWRAVNNIARTLELMRDRAEASGASFTVAIVPNKNTVYGEHMPYNYFKAGEEGNLELLMRALGERGVTAADLTAAFRGADGVLYQKTDSHWDYRGALLGYRTIAEAAGCPHEEFEGLTFEPRADWSGDLAGMLYADGSATDVQYYPEHEFGYETVSHEKAPDAITLRTKNPNGSGSLVMYRDSFCNTMHVYFAESFAEAVFSRAYPYDTGLIDKYGADVCVLEIVERNIPNLAKRAPVMEAPRVVFSASAKHMDGVVICSEKKNGYIHIYGSVDPGYLGDSYRVYVMAETDGGQAVYEAFPVFESELLGSEAVGDNGFSAYFKEETWAGFDTVRIIAESDGGCYIGDPS